MYCPCQSIEKKTFFDYLYIPYGYVRIWEWIVEIRIEHWQAHVHT